MRHLTHLEQLEAESIHIIREAVAESERPVMLYSIGKDSSVMLHLAMKAFTPAKPPFPLLHVDTTWKFQAMYEFRDRAGGQTRPRAHRLPEPGVRRPGHQSLRPWLGPAHRHVEDRGLKQALDHHGFDARVRWRPARRGEVAGQGAKILPPLGPAPVGPEAAAPGAVAPLQRSPEPGRDHAGLPAVELDRARRVAVHLPASTSPSSPSTWLRPDR